MRTIRFTAALLALSLGAVPALAAGKGKIDGKKLFEEHCVSCHLDGGNVVTPAKTLKKMDREANGVKSWQDIVRTMRKPGPGMTQFDRKTIPDREARAIAEYILKTFK